MKEKRLKPNYSFMRKEPEAKLQNYYTILLETGLILALLILTALARIDFTASESDIITVMEQEAVEMEEIIQTQQIETPPPPPRPPSPVAVPNDEIIEDVDIMIDAEMDFDSQLATPPPPQQDEEEEEDFFVVVEQMPELIGGLQAIQNEIRYPERALRAGIQGRVYVQFIVNERGGVEMPEVIRGIGGGCDEEAVRVVQNAKFQPGMQRGRPVRVQFYLPVIFRITEDS